MTARENQVEGGGRRRPWGRWDALAAVFLVAAAVLPYAPALHNGFVNYDDPNYVTENRHVRSGLSIATLRWAFETGAAANWHPVTWMSHALDCQIYGLRPAGHHATSVAIHAINTLLLFLVLTRLTEKRGRSAVVAALFAVHPLHVESVAWVAERKDVLSMMFGLTAMGAYIAYARSRSKAWYAVVVGALALSLMSKPMFVTLPLILALLDYWPLRRPGQVPFMVLVAEKIPLLLLSVASSVVTVYVQAAGKALRTVDDIPLSWRVENALVSCVAYLEKMIWPVGLSVYYPHPGATLTWGGVAGAAALLAAVTVAAWHGRVRRPYLMVGWLWYLVALTPVIGIVQVGRQAMADRYTYFPLIGVFIGLVWGCGEILERRRRLVGVAAVGTLAILAAFGAVTWRQTQYWRNSEVLFRRALAVTRGNFIADSNLASALLDQERYGEAEPLCREAIALNPNYVDAYINLGIALGGQGRLPEALAALTRATQLSPQLAGAHFNLGVAFARHGEPAQAAAQFRRTLELDPEDEQARKLLEQIAPGTAPPAAPK